MVRPALLLPACVPFALVLAPAHVGAETSKSFSVTAVIATGCAVATDGAGHWGQINLGTVNGAIGGSASASLLNSGISDLRINCTPGTTVNVTADNGDHATGGARRLGHATDAASFVPYTLYANGSQTPWTSQSIGLSFPVGTSQRLLPVSAQATVPAATRAGTYSDTVRVTVSW
jgi:spore coat protein U-like protein